MQFKILYTICFLCLCVISLSGIAQISFPSKSIDKELFDQQIEELKLKFGHHKKLPAGFELPCLIALSRYPELAHVKIEFVFKKIATTMAARPCSNVLFRKGGNRDYRIFINTDAEKIKGVLLHQVPFNAQVGIIGHELAHILDYESKSAGGLVVTGIRYVSKKFRSRMEKETDQIAIQRGFGWQLYAFTDYLFTCKEVPASYLEYKKKVYYCPKDFLNMLKRNPQYSEGCQEPIVSP